MEKTYKITHWNCGELIIFAPNALYAAYRAAQMWGVKAGSVIKRAQIKEIAAGAGTPNGKTKKILIKIYRRTGEKSSERLQ